MADNRLHLAPILSVALAISACSQGPGEISNDTEPFSDISDTASISAIGTEPFWALEIEPQGDGYSASYSNPENIDGTSFEVHRFAGNNGIGFSGELDGGPLQVALTPGKCSDAMSDREYPYIATVAMKSRTLFGCAYTSEEPFSGPEAP